MRDEDHVATAAPPLPVQRHKLAQQRDAIGGRTALQEVADVRRATVAEVVFERVAQGVDPTQQLGIAQLIRSGRRSVRAAVRR